MLQKMLAFYHYPFTCNQNFREYTEEDLIQPSKVEELFDYCQILEAYIAKSGLQFLIAHYGYEGLYDIAKKSGWPDTESMKEFITHVEMLMESGAVFDR